MPAEKLTLSRFIHITVLFIVLMTAFIWRTVTTPDVNHFRCENRKRCVVPFEGENILISSQNNTFTLVISGQSSLKSLPFSINPEFEEASSRKNDVTLINKKSVKSTIVFKSEQSSLIIHLPKDG